MSEHDEATVAALRRLAAAHAPGDGWQPDPHEVIRRGQRLRTRRITGTTTAGVLVLALAVGVPAALSGHRAPVAPGRPTATTSATTTSPPPRSFGSGPVAELEDGAAAVNVPARVSATELHVGDVAGYSADIVQTGDVVHVRLVGGSRLVDNSISLTDGGSPAAYGHAGTTYPNVTEYGRGTTSPVSVFVGVLPSWQRDPTAYLFSSAGWPSGAGTGGAAPHAAEVPTFHPPAADGRLMYVVVLTGSARTTFTGSPHTVAFAGAAGDAFWPECGRSTGTGTAEETGTCAQMLGVSPDELQLTTTKKFDWLLSNPESSQAASGGHAAPGPSRIGPGVLAATGAGAPEADGFVQVGTFNGFVARIGRDGSDTDSMAMLSLVSPDGTVTGAEPVSRQPLGSWGTVGYSVGIDTGPSAGWFMYGTVPSAMPDAHAFVYSPVGFTQAGGGTTSVLMLPTFQMPPMPNNPIEDGRRWFVVGFTGDAIGAVRSDSGFPFAARVIFAGSDGTVEDSSCLIQAADSPCQGQERTDAGSQAAYGTVRQLVAKDVSPRR